jgi:2,3-bisphosphoglycerate-dependent phosphoglycerate mutase
MPESRRAMTSTTCHSSPLQACLLFARHGATAPNLAGLRCGGDLDPPLADEGRRQAMLLARRVASRPEPLDLIVSSDLVRARETAAIVRAALGPIEMRLVPGFRERRLGAWNLQPIADTERELAAGDCPPGGESSAEFAHRIRAALELVKPELHRRVLLVASKGVGRVLRQLAGLAPTVPMVNAELIELHFPMPAASTVMEGAA